MEKKYGLKLVEELKSGKRKKLKQSDTIPFKCTACGKCCFNTDILLNAYDIIRLRHGLGISTKELLQKKYISFHIGPSSGLPVAMIEFQQVDEKLFRCPFLSPAIRAQVIMEELKKLKKVKSKSEMKRLMTIFKENPSQIMKEIGKVKIERWLCSVHSDRPIVCRFYPTGRIKSGKKNQEIRDYENTFFLQDPPKYCNGFKTKEKQTLKKFLKDANFYQYDEGSAKFYEIIEKLAKSGLFASTKENSKKLATHKPLLSDGSKVFFIIANMLYNFDSFIFFSEDNLVQRTITEKDQTHENFMYVLRKIEMMINLLIKIYKTQGGEAAFDQFTNMMPNKGGESNNGKSQN